MTLRKLIRNTSIIPNDVKHSCYTISLRSELCTPPRQQCERESIAHSKIVCYNHSTTLGTHNIDYYQPDKSIVLNPEKIAIAAKSAGIS
ncbi:MAG: hypothetical protein WAM14_21495 [Candidatus Nitrosopolaris sp.]